MCRGIRGELNTGSFGGRQPPRSWAVATVVSCLDCRMLVTYTLLKSPMLGETVRSTRIKRGFTQARLARLAGVSRRHLAALEKGANVSINVLQKVASVLDLSEINLGELIVQTPKPDSSAVNLSILAA